MLCAKNKNVRYVIEVKIHFLNMGKIIAPYFCLFHGIIKKKKISYSHLETFFYIHPQPRKNTKKEDCFFPPKPYFSGPKNCFLQKKTFWSWKMGFWKKKVAFFLCVFFSLGGGWIKKQISICTYIFYQCFFFVFFCTPDFCDSFKNNCNLKIYIFCPLRAETFFKALITVAISRTYWNYFFKNILFTRRRRKNFEVLITAALLSGTSLKLFFESTFFSACHRLKFWDPNNGPVSGISLKLFFSKYAFFSARRRRKNFWGSFNLCNEKSFKDKQFSDRFSQN